MDLQVGEVALCQRAAVTRTLSINTSEVDTVPYRHQTSQFPADLISDLSNRPTSFYRSSCLNSALAINPLF